MISFKEEGKKFNYRVGAIILNHDRTKILLHTIKGYGFYLLPGGRVEWLENCEQAIKRELEEELGLINTKPRARIFMEDFFIFNNIEFQEISTNFVVELEKEHKLFKQKEEFCGKEGEKYLYKWFDIKDIDNIVIKPEILKNIIKNYNKAFEYIVLDERQ